MKNSSFVTDRARDTGVHKPKKVAIIGGGCAAMATAWELTKPELQGQFEITVYQMGWRLGGKGASGRGPNGRIEEHGLHLWMGHYDNAFALMREAYAALDRDPKQCSIATWQDAFKKAPYVGLADQTENGQWRRLMAHFPDIDGLPGDPPDPATPSTVSGYVSRSIRLLLALIKSADSMDDLDAAVSHAFDKNTRPNGAKKTQTTIISEINRFLRYGQLTSLTTLVQAIHTLEAVLRILPGIPSDLIGRFLTAVTSTTHRQIEPLLQANTESQYLWEIIDIMLAVIRGCITSGLITDPRGFDAIDDYDARAWLRLNGAAERSVNSAFMRGIYDLAFAYEDGDPEKPGVSAGAGLRGGLRMFMGYRGSVFWKMPGWNGRHRIYPTV